MSNPLYNPAWQALILNSTGNKAKREMVFTPATQSERDERFFNPVAATVEQTPKATIHRIK